MASPLPSLGKGDLMTMPSPTPPMVSVFNLPSQGTLGSWSEKGDGPSHSPPLALVSGEREVVTLPIPTSLLHHSSLALNKDIGAIV